MTIDFWNLGKGEKAKIKEHHFRRPANCKPNFFTNWIFYWRIRCCTHYEFSLNQMSDIHEVWKYWPLKDAFRSISKKIYRAAILWWVDQKTSDFYQAFLLRATFKYCIAEFTATFLCLLLSWSRRYSMKWSSNFDGPWFQQ